MRAYQSIHTTRQLSVYKYFRPPKDAFYDFNAEDADKKQEEKKLKSKKRSSKLIVDMKLCFNGNPLKSVGFCTLNALLLIIKLVLAGCFIVS